MARVTAIINARLFVIVSADPDMPAVFSTAMLLNPKTNAVVVPLGILTPKAYKANKLKSLGDSFSRSKEYLFNSTTRKKMAKGTIPV